MLYVTSNTTLHVMKHGRSASENESTSTKKIRGKRGFRKSLMPFFQAHCIVKNKCMCIFTKVIRHLSLALGIRTQDLVCHDCFFLWIPYSMHCSSDACTLYKIQEYRPIDIPRLCYPLDVIKSGHNPSRISCIVQ